MRFYLFQLHSSLRLSSAILVMVALFLSVFCLTPSITSAAHGGHMEESAEVTHSLEPINQECCHGIFHDKNHESIKITIDNQQTIKQMVAVDTSNFSNYTFTDISNINDLSYLENFKKGASPPNSILRC